jgi:predicted metal-binding membrane protein
VHEVDRGAHCQGDEMTSGVWFAAGYLLGFIAALLICARRQP